MASRTAGTISVAQRAGASSAGVSSVLRFGGDAAAEVVDVNDLRGIPALTES